MSDEKLRLRCRGCSWVGMRSELFVSSYRHQFGPAECHLSCPRCGCKTFKPFDVPSKGRVGQGGFTLLEVMIVVAVLAISLAIIIPAWRGGHAEVVCHGGGEILFRRDRARLAELVVYFDGGQYVIPAGATSYSVYMEDVKNEK